MGVMEPLLTIWLPVAVTVAAGWRLRRRTPIEDDRWLRALARVVGVAPLVAPAAVRIVPRGRPALRLVRDDDVA